MVLSHPNQVEKALHCEILGELRTALQSFLAQSAGVAPCRVREWQFVLEEGMPTVQIFLDKNLAGEAKVGPEIAVALDDCLAVHRGLVEAPVLARFADDVAVEVSSAGVEPLLRESFDFVAVVGQRILVETWEKPNRSQAGTLVAFEESVDALILDVGGDSMRLPRETVRLAKFPLPGPAPQKGKKKR